MRQRLYKFAFILLLTVAGAMPADRVCAQPTADTAISFGATRNITPAEWEDLANDDIFKYRDQVEYSTKPPKENALIKALAAFIRLLTTTLGQIIVWSLLAAIVLYAVYRIVISDRSSLFGRRARTMQEQEETGNTEDITETNWESLLQKAVRENDLRMAVRNSYMLLLQILQQRELIQYRNDKTNYEYLSELTDTPYKSSFRQLSRQYEYTWYGNFPISAETYDSYMGLLGQLKKQLGR
jgi:hypothetical protein